MLVEWDPWKEFDEIWKEMDQILDSYLARLSPEREVGFVPAAEVGEVGGELQVRVALPGVIEEDIDITLQPDRITIRGERQKPPGYARARWGTHEIRYGQFVREIAIPESAGQGEVRAVFSDGILTITVSKKGT